MRHDCIAVTVLAGVAVTTSARAEDFTMREQLGTYYEPPPPPSWSVMVSPFSLVRPVLQLGVEHSFARKVSLVVTGAYGTVITDDPLAAQLGRSTTHRVTMTLGEADVRWYGVGSFVGGAGLFGGVRAVKLPTDQVAEAALYDVASRVGVVGGMMLKYTFRSHIAVEALAGLERGIVALTPRNHATDGIVSKPPPFVIVFGANIGVTF